MAQERVLHGRPTLIGSDLVGTIFQPSIIDRFTIVEKARIVNHTSTAFFARLLIMRLGQTVQGPEQFVIHDKAIPPNSTYVVRELFGESMDAGSKIVGDVLDGGGTNLQTGNLSFSMTTTVKRW